MSDIIFELLKIVVMLAALVLARYIIPYVQKRIGKENTELIAQWAKYAVLMAQQVMESKPTEERKAYVTEFLKQLLIEKNISLTDEQLDILIESAVKQMKIDDNSEIHIEAVEAIEATDCIKEFPDNADTESTQEEKDGE